MELPFYLPQLQPHSIIPWIQPSSTIHIPSPLHAQATPYQLTPVHSLLAIPNTLNKIEQLKMAETMENIRETQPILCFLNNNKYYDLKENYASKLIFMCPHNSKATR